MVYANYGRREDFELLAKSGVNVDGAIVICRYGRLFRGSKADNAHNAGAKALLIYSDPADYAKEGTDPENVYPNTRFLPGTGVQRGTIFTGSGDPLTPGAPAGRDAYRLDPEDRDEYIATETCPNEGGCTTWGTLPAALPVSAAICVLTRSLVHLAHGMQARKGYSPPFRHTPSATKTPGRS